MVSKVDLNYLFVRLLFFYLLVVRLANLFINGTLRLGIFVFFR